MYFHEQRLVARLAKYPFLERFWRSYRFFERNSVNPDKSSTDRTAPGFVPASFLSCFSPGGNCYTISWYHNFVRSLSFPGVLPDFTRKVISSLLALHFAV